jgi:hypothetical protein
VSKVSHQPRNWRESGGKPCSEELVVLSNHRLALLAVALLLSGQTVFAAGADSLADVGRHIYRTAIRPDGTSLKALVQADVELPGSSAACVNCHRRSGIGISEGGSRSLNLTAPALFSASLKPPLRPAYDDTALIRAIVAGIAADGRVLSLTMP